MGSTKPETTKPNEMIPLASRSLPLLVVMVFLFTKENNNYREALFRCNPGKINQTDQQVRLDEVATLQLGYVTNSTLIL